jgi:hypothetical protein
MNTGRGWWLVGVLWGIPAFLGWLLLGIFLQLSYDRERLTRFERCREALDDVVRQSEMAGGAFQERLLNGLPALLHPELPAGEGLADRVRSFLAPYPQGSLEVYLYAGDGRLLFPLPTFGSKKERKQHKQAAELTFAYVKAPWSVGKFAGRLPWNLPVQIVSGGDSTYNIARQRPDQLIKVAGEGETSPDHLLFRWIEGRGADHPAGVLLVVRGAHLPTEEVLTLALAAWHDSEIQIGWRSAQGPQILAGSWSSDLFAACARLVGRQPTGKGAGHGWLASGREFGSGNLIAALPEPRLAGWGMLGVALLYFLGSVPFMRVLLRLGRGEPSRYSVPWKLSGIMSLGILFPLACAASLAWLYLDEQRHSVVNDFRQEAWKHLDAIDAGFERHLRELELTYRNICHESSPASFSLPTLLKTLRSRREEFRLEDFYLVASTGEIIAMERNSFLSRLGTLAAKPMAERLPAIDAVIRRGAARSLRQMNYLFGHLDPPEPVTEKAPDERMKAIMPVMQTMGRIAMTNHNARHGLPALPAPRGKALVTAGLLEGEFGSLAALAGANLYGLQATRSPAGSGYFFSTVIANAQKESQYYLFTTNEFGTTGGGVSAAYLPSRSICGRFRMEGPQYRSKARSLLPEHGGRGHLCRRGSGNGAIHRIQADDAAGHRRRAV